MTLLSTITNDEINKNLKERFFNQEIYVCSSPRAS
jgi:myosin-1